MKKYYLLLLTCACFILVLTSCGNQGDSTVTQVDTGKAPTTKAFTEDSIILLIDSKPFEKTTSATDEEAIKALIYQWNKTLLSSLFSGTATEMPLSDCAGTDTCDKLNRLIKRSLAEKGTLGNNVDSYHFDIHFDTLLTDDTTSKVIITRMTDVQYKNQQQSTNSSEKEGYVLTKKDGKWVINNILPSTVPDKEIFEKFSEENALDSIASEYAISTLPPTNDTGTIYIPRDPTARAY